MSLFYYLSLFFSFFLRLTKKYRLRGFELRRGNTIVIFLINVINVVGGFLILVTGVIKIM